MKITHQSTHPFLLLSAVVCALSLTSQTASAQPLRKPLNTGDRILRGSHDWSEEQSRKEVAQHRAGGLEAVTGQKTLAWERNSNVFFFATKEQAARAAKPSALVLGTGDIYGVALRQANGGAVAKR
jgi:hypothetical protein